MKKVIKEEMKSADEIELEELIKIRDGLTKYKISTNSRLGILIEDLDRRVKAEKNK